MGRIKTNGKGLSALPDRRRRARSGTQAASIHGGVARKTVTSGKLDSAPDGDPGNEHGQDRLIQRNKDRQAIAPTVAVTNEPIRFVHAKHCRPNRNRPISAPNNRIPKIPNPQSTLCVNCSGFKVPGDRPEVAVR